MFFVDFTRDEALDTSPDFTGFIIFYEHSRSFILYLYDFAVIKKKKKSLLVHTTFF